MLVSQSRFCRSLFGSVNENLLYEVCYLRLSRGSGTFLFYPVNNVYHSLYHSLYHSFPDTVILISQSCFSSSDYTAVDSALRFVTLRRHSLSLPDFDERLVPPVSSVLLHCSLSYLASLVGHDLVSKPVSFFLEEVLIVTGFVISGHDYPMASRVRLGLVPLVSTPVSLLPGLNLAVTGFDSAGRLSQPTFHVAGGKCTVTVLTRVPYWAPILSHVFF